MFRCAAGLAVYLSLFAALGCATTRSRPGPVPPPPKTTTLGALLSHAGELDLAPELIASLEKADQKLTATLAPAMHELSAYVTSKEGDKNRPPPPLEPIPAEHGTSPGVPVGTGHHHGGHNPSSSGSPKNAQAHEVAALTKRIEDAEMGAYLEVEKTLSPAQRERARELVSAVWEELLQRDTAIRRLFGLEE